MVNMIKKIKAIFRTKENLKWWEVEELLEEDEIAEYLELAREIDRELLAKAPPEDQELAELLEVAYMIKDKRIDKYLLDELMEVLNNRIDKACVETPEKASKIAKYIEVYVKCENHMIVREPECRKLFVKIEEVRLMMGKRMVKSSRY
jgi:hypothetical protein